MKNILLITFFVTGQLVFGQMDSIYIDKPELDLGDVIQGDAKEFEFVLVNHSSETISLSDAVVTCGCTVPDWSTEPIFSKDERVIKARFNSEKKEGFIRKKIVLVLSNGERRTFSFLVNVIIEE